MTDAAHQLAAFVDALLKGKRPPRFPAERTDGDALRAAAALRAATPGADAPRPEFVERLSRQLAAATGLPARVPLSRRRLLAQLSVPAAAAFLGAAAATAIRAAIDSLGPHRHASDQDELVPRQTGRWVPVAPVASLNVGQPVRFTAGAITGFVVMQDDAIQAISAVCTHMGCLLVPNQQLDRLDCPCHGASFTLGGTPLDPEYSTPLPRLHVRVAGHIVEVFTIRTHRRFA